MWLFPKQSYNERYKLLSKEDKTLGEKKGQKEREREISSLISSKILDYKSKLDSVPVQIIPVEESEQDRKEVNNQYELINSTNNQLLDSKFYTQILKMNRERDKSFLKEGTTRKERITILAQLISRVTTPIIFLNHKRNIQLSKLHILENENSDQKEQIKDIIEYKDPETDFEMPYELTGIEIQQLKKDVLEKVLKKGGFLNSLEDLNLTDWEADILSQLTRDEEIQIILDTKNGTIQIVKDKAENKRKKIISFLYEPKNKDSIN